MLSKEVIQIYSRKYDNKKVPKTLRTTVVSFPLALVIKYYRMRDRSTNFMLNAHERVVMRLYIVLMMLE